MKSITALLVFTIVLFQAGVLGASRDVDVHSCNISQLKQDLNSLADSAIDFVTALQPSIDDVFNQLAVCGNDSFLKIISCLLSLPQTCSADIKQISSQIDSFLPLAKRQALALINDVEACLPSKY